MPPDKGVQLVLCASQCANIPAIIGTAQQAKIVLCMELRCKPQTLALHLLTHTLAGGKALPAWIQCTSQHLD